MRRQFGIRVLTILVAFFVGGCGSGGSGGASGGGNPGGGVTIGIGSSGGSVTSSDTKVTVTVPADAVSQAMNITIAVASNTPSGNVGTAYELGPDGYTFNKPLTFSLTYADSVLPTGTIEANLRLGTVVNNTWVEVPGATVDVNTNTISGSISHFSVYGFFIVNSNSSEKAITGFSFGAVTGTVNETAKTIAVTMPTGTNVTALVAIFTTTGANVKVGTTVQSSGTTTNNFTNPIIYTVTAADGTTTAYNVTVTVENPVVGAGCPTLVPENFSGGCRIYLVSPANCGQIDFNARGNGYVEFDYSTDTTFCEGPHTFTIGGNPSSTWQNGNGLLWKLSSGSFDTWTMTRNIGGAVQVSRQDLAGITTDNGQYHWRVESFYGSASASGTFTVKP